MFTFFTLVNSTEEGHICRPFFFYLSFSRHLWGTPGREAKHLLFWRRGDIFKEKKRNKTELGLKERGGFFVERRRREAGEKRKTGRVIWGTNEIRDKDFVVVDFQVRLLRAWHFLLFLIILFHFLWVDEHGSFVCFGHQEFLSCFGWILLFVYVTLFWLYLIFLISHCKWSDSCLGSGWCLMVILLFSICLTSFQSVDNSWSETAPNKSSSLSSLLCSLVNYFFILSRYPFPTHAQMNCISTPILHFPSCFLPIFSLPKH